ncbi:MAG: hypothetical protein LBE36_12320 [Flavobacteriaceae bacterium]|jgi:hypothetical protein|nr:hypothetical protein [Flavobacteriaceae bacterium]
MKKFLLLFLLFSVFQSCQNYFFLTQETPDKSDGYLVHTLKFSNQTLEFATFGDYHINKIDKRFIFFKTKDVRKLLNQNFKKPFDEQFLFTYTNLSSYNNILGFYYGETSLENVKKSYPTQPNISLKNGILYSYDFGKFKVIDIYKETENGIIRFINLNDPNGKIEHFYRENSQLYFELNPYLWTWDEKYLTSEDVLDILNKPEK